MEENNPALENGSIQDPFIDEAQSEPSPSFADFELNKQLLNALNDAGFKIPTLIQQKAIPSILAGHDVVGVAPTGTGKTAAYLLPLLMKVKYAQGSFPRAAVLVPTRELTTQVAKQVEQLSAYLDIRTQSLYGGIGPKAQAEALKKGCDLVIATPGRFLDHYLSGALVLKDLKTLILDEADRMLDMGFMPQIRRVLEVVPRKRQNLLFSATMSDRVKILVEEFVEFPVVIEAAPSATPAETIALEVYRVPNIGTKLNYLVELMGKETVFNRVILFTKTKENAEAVFKHLQGKIRGTIRVMHGNKGQNSRINAVEMFREGDVRLLIATDVAARGIDIPDVSHVINFDVPMVYEDFVHRIGRTGRAGKVGMAITFVTDADEPHFERVEKLIRQKLPRLDLPETVAIKETPFSESQTMLKHLDTLRKKADPSFKGAFHEKKRQPARAASKEGRVSKGNKKSSPSNGAARSNSKSLPKNMGAKKRR